MSFDWLAPHYRWMELVLAGNKLQRCRTAFLDKAISPERVLILGEGNGRFLLECRGRLERARITCVDSSRRMLQQAQERLQRRHLPLTGIDFIHADALDWQPPASSFDVIVTHFFLDCFRPDQLRDLIDALARAARPTAQWLLADFQIPASGLKRLRARAIHQLMYLFFRIACRLPARQLSAPDPMLEANGFRLQDRRLSEWGLLHSDWWQRQPSSLQG